MDYPDSLEADAMRIMSRARSFRMEVHKRYPNAPEGYSDHLAVTMALLETRTELAAAPVVTIESAPRRPRTPEEMRDRIESLENTMELMIHDLVEARADANGLRLKKHLQSAIDRADMALTGRTAAQDEAEGKAVREPHRLGQCPNPTGGCKECP